MMERIQPVSRPCAVWTMICFFNWNLALVVCETLARTSARFPPLSSESALRQQRYAHRVMEPAGPGSSWRRARSRPKFCSSKSFRNSPGQRLRRSPAPNSPIAVIRLCPTCRAPTSMSSASGSCCSNFGEALRPLAQYVNQRHRDKARRERTIAGQEGAGPQVNGTCGGHPSNQRDQQQPLGRGVHVGLVEQQT